MRLAGKMLSLHKAHDTVHLPSKMLRVRSLACFGACLLIVKDELLE